MEYKIIKGRNYLLACSFSAESMALLDWLLRRNCHPIVLFVDYKEAPSSAEDLVGVKQYCAENGLVIEVCDATKIPAKDIRNGPDRSAMTSSTKCTRSTPPPPSSSPIPRTT